MDSNVTPQYDVPLWSETRWNGCWNAEQGVGLYLHMGRCRFDLDMWWVQVVVYLPEQQLCVTKLWGRSDSAAGVRVGGLELVVGEDEWTATFDGVGQLTSIDALARAPQGSSAPVRSMGFEVKAIGIAPQWDMYAGTSDRLEFAGDTHVQQGYETAGTLTVGGDAYRFDGVGFKDHSSGPRDFTKWTSHRFFMIPTREWTAHAIVMFSPDGEPLPAVGAFFRDGKQSAITRFELPELADSAGGPRAGDCVIETDSGEHFEFVSELVHSLPMMITIDNDNINGVDWTLDGDPVVLIEGKGSLTASDGTVVHCFHERSALRSHVSLPPS